MLSTLFLDGENAAELLGGLDYAYLFSYAFGPFNEVKARRHVKAAAARETDNESHLQYNPAFMTQMAFSVDSGGISRCSGGARTSTKNCVSFY